MVESTPTGDSAAVLITDFDGTMTLFKLAIEKLLPPGTPEYWAEYQSGSITYFESLR